MHHSSSCTINCACSSCICPLEYRYNTDPPSTGVVQPQPAGLLCGPWSLGSLTAPILALPHQLRARPHSKPFTAIHTQTPVSPQLPPGSTTVRDYLGKMPLTSAPPPVPQLYAVRSAADRPSTRWISKLHRGWVLSHSRTCITYEPSQWCVCSRREVWHKLKFQATKSVKMSQMI